MIVMEGESIQQFWQTHPCGAELVGDLSSETRDEYAEFFARYDEYRYSKEAHILTNLDRISWNGKSVLEIGLGQGADAEQIVRRGGVYSGVDLTDESVKRVTMRFALDDLPYKRIEQASALQLPFEKDAFDVVYSHGVLHHIPEIRHAAAEIYRVLKPGGQLIMMLYAKWSLNYLFAIGVARRLGLATLCLTGIRPKGIYGDHFDNARKVGLSRYLSMPNFVSVSTDGPFNPYSKVYDRREIERDFPEFEIIETHKEFIHAPPLPVAKLPFSSLLGWHLWATLTPKK